MSDNNNNQDKSKYKLDYTLTTAEERTKHIDNIIQNGADTSQHSLEIYTNYILEALSKEEKQEGKIFTENRLITINKHETSYEGLATKFENGEDGLQTILKPYDKNALFAPKDKITDKDIAEIPGLRELTLAIDKVLAAFQKATGKQKFYLKRQLIELYQDRYVLKEAYHKPIQARRLTQSHFHLTFDEDITVIDNVDVVTNSKVSFYNQDCVAAILRIFPLLKEQSQGQISSDLYYLVAEFEALVQRALEDLYPELYLIFKLKNKNINCAIIQQELKNQYDIKYSAEHLSTLWRSKIPKLITERAKDEYLEWYYTYKDYGKWKKCSCCGEIKLASPRFFSKNKSARDGLYSVCKLCRTVRKIKKSGQK